MKKILLVNPWIYDFAAYDFGIKPTGLLRIAEFFRRNGEEIYLIDCLDGCSGRKDKYGFSKIKKTKIEKPPIISGVNRPYLRYGISMEEFLRRLRKVSNVDKIYMASGMTYWYPGVQLAIRILKERFPSVPITLGGIYATLCYDHARSTSGADTVFKGNYLDVDYFTQKGFYPAFDLIQNREILPIQLTSGCPFKCSYCVSRIFAPDFIMKNPAYLFDEIIYYSEKFHTEKFTFLDDALTHNAEKGIKEFLRLIISCGRQFTFYTINGVHARYIDEELAALLKAANFKDLRLSLETSDMDLQKATGNKVTTDDLEKAVKYLKAAGFKKEDMGVYIMMGSRWLTLKKTHDDILYINSLGAKAMLASYSPIPGSEDYRQLVKNGIIREDSDPLLHNKTISSELFISDYEENARHLRRLASRLNKTGP